MSLNPPKCLKPLDDSRLSWLTDESRLGGRAETCSLPANLEACAEIVDWCRESGSPLTVQGARTGLCGAAVPKGGHVMSLVAMNRPIALCRSHNGLLSLEVRPGMTLAELSAALASRRLDNLEESDRYQKELKAEFRRLKLFWPPDPGEGSATIGGLAATNARGPNAWRMGSAGDHIASIRLLGIDGRLRHVNNRQLAFDNGRLRLPKAILPRKGEPSFGPVDPALLNHPDHPELPGAGREYSTLSELTRISPAALGMSPDARAMGLVLGSQGALGIITSLTLTLALRPQENLGLAFFFKAEEAAARFIEAILAVDSEDGPWKGDLASLTSLDFLDEASMALVSGLKKTAARLSSAPSPPSGSKAAVLTEILARSSEEADRAAERLMSLCLDSGGDPDDTWAVAESDIERLKMFRHAVPEALGANLDQLRARGASDAARLGLDATFPGTRFGEFLSRLRKELSRAGLSGAIFGHAPQNHLHLSIVETGKAKTEAARSLIEDLSRQAIAFGGKLFPEHGAGKTKAAMWERLERPDKVRALRKVKSLMDPLGLLNPGNWPLGGDS